MFVIIKFVSHCVVGSNQFIVIICVCHTASWDCDLLALWLSSFVRHYLALTSVVMGLNPAHDHNCNLIISSLYIILAVKSGTKTHF